MVVWRDADMAILRPGEMTAQPEPARGVVEGRSVAAEIGANFREEQARRAPQRRDLRAQRAACLDARRLTAAYRRDAADRPGLPIPKEAGRDQAFLVDAVAAVAVDDGQAGALVGQHDAKAR